MVRSPFTIKKYRLYHPNKKAPVIRELKRSDEKLIKILAWQK